MARLSLTYHGQGRQPEAETLGLQVMELRKKVLGPEHHHTLTSTSNLASIYYDGGQFAKAEELLLQVLAMRIKVLGMEHHHTLTCMEQLAAMYRKQGRLMESEDLESQVSEARNKAFPVRVHLDVPIFNPNRPDWDSTWREDINFAPYREQVLWELDKQVAADLVVYLPPATLAPISLLEFGLSAQVPGKGIAIAPEGYSKRANVQIVCQKFGIEFLDTMDRVHEMVIDKLHLNQ
ncbi:Nephrocystin-3 [Metarhizium brunneum]|uniref:Nephrocystin-3 n=1 Tax=Metarhizium brunneum TaxID=500148 RepID=A0A7D5Z8G7_9HYPO